MALPVFTREHNSVFKNIQGVQNYTDQDIKEDKFIDKGGFAEVTRGTIIQNKKTIAIKKLITANPLQQKLFVKEIDILKDLTHENIVQLEGIIITSSAILLEYCSFDFKPLSDDKVVYTLEYLLHELDKHMDFQGFENTVIHIAHGVASGLTYLHERGIAHRDLKPANILVSNQHYARADPEDVAIQFREKPVIAKLTDFGESRSDLIQTRTLNSVACSDTSDVKRGTTAFQAPEIHIISSNSNISKESLQQIDIWAFGMVLWCSTNANLGFPYAAEVEEALDAGRVNNQTAYVIDLLKKGRLPKQSDKYMEKKHDSWAKVVQIMDSCLKYNPRERISAQEASSCLDPHMERLHCAALLQINKATVSSMPARKKINELIEAFEDYLRLSREVITWMISLEEPMKKHSIGVNVFKTVGGLLGVASVPFYFFPPLIPVGIGLSVAAGVTSGGAAVGDIVKSLIANNYIKEQMETLKESSDRLKGIEEAMQEEATALANETGLSQEEAYFSICQGVIHSKHIIGSLINFENPININSSNYGTTRNTPDKFAIVVGKGAALGACGAIGLFGFVVPLLDDVVIAGARGGAVAGATAAVRIIGLAAAGIGAAIGIGDAIYGWATTNAALKKAIQLAKEIKDGRETMKELKEIYENMKKSPVNNLSVVIGGDLIEMSKKLIPAGNNTCTVNDSTGLGYGPSNARQISCNAFAGLQQFKSGNSLYDILLKWLEGMLQKLLDLNYKLGPLNEVTVHSLTNEVNMDSSVKSLKNLQQFALTRFLQCSPTMSSNQEIAVPFIPKEARPTTGRNKAVMNSEDDLLAGHEIPLTFDVNKNGTKMTIIYTQNVTFLSQRGITSSWLARVEQFAKQNPDTACFVMYHKPWAGCDVSWLEQIDNLPRNIAFIEVDFIASREQKTINNLKMELKNCLMKMH